MKKAVYYRHDQVLPPRHWYQKSIGWFGKTLTGVLVLSLIGTGSYGYIMNRATTTRLSADTSQADRLQKVTSPLEVTSPENIIDVQYVLDQWSETHPGQTWSVAVQSISGPQFSAELNQDKKYTSGSLQKLLLAIPLYQQVPVEHQKNIQLSAGDIKKSMQACVDVMIRLSDEACTEAVMQYVDLRKGTDALKKLGLQRTSFEENMHVRTTAQDVTKYLVAVQNGGLTRNASSTLVRLLREQQYRSGIPTGCPGCQVANKSFPEESIIHDAALISYSGGSYALTIMTADGESSDVGLLAGDIQQKIVDTLTK